MYTLFVIAAVVALSFQSLLLYLAFFGPRLPYRVKQAPDLPIDSDEFCGLLSTITDAQLYSGNRIEVITNGENFYPAEIEAIQSAQKTVNLEAFIYYKGEIAQRYVDALAERARAGVKVKVILDFLGSFGTHRSYFRPLLEAGGLLEWYHPPKLDLLPQINNRTHRELLIIDGETAFIGGAGVADMWYHGDHGEPAWRDTMCRVDGPAVCGLQSVFAENWLRVSGEILTGREYFSSSRPRVGCTALVVNSTPAEGSTRARILFQLLIACAQKKIYITTPYFLPDPSAIQAVTEAIRERHVEVKILTPGKHSDHAYTRSSSQRLYGAILKAGGEIYEYAPAMIHAKVMLIDDLWSVVGSTNFDHRSFEINDEVNLAISDRAIAARLRSDFENDLTKSKQIHYEDWRKRSRFRAYEWLGALIEKQE